MPAFSLVETEKTLSTLWLNAEVRNRFLKGESGPIDPSMAPLIDRDGVVIYASLLEAGANQLMQSIFPLSERLLRKDWNATVKDFLLHYPPSHYNLNQAARPFPQYLKMEGARHLKKYPYLPELAEYEWIELEVLECDSEASLSPAQPLKEPLDFAAFAPIVNPALALRKFEYPITQIAQRLQSKKKMTRVMSRKSTCVAAYRDPEGNRCTYLELKERVFDLIADARLEERSFADLIARSFAAHPGDDPQSQVIELLEAIDDLNCHHLFLGTRALQAR